MASNTKSLTTLALNTDVYLAMKAYCKEEGRTLQWAVSQAMKKYLESEGYTVQTAPPNS